MQKIALVANCDKVEAVELLSETIDFLTGWGCEIMVEEETASEINKETEGSSLLTLGQEADLVVAFGGDGTLLKMARKMALLDKPILGINLGQLGFLTELEVFEYKQGLKQVLNGEFTIDRRMMVKARVCHPEVSEEFTALNDVVINKGSFSRLAEFKLFVEEDFVDTYLADGLIVSSPTGSTAYSLSAGGPIINPELDLLLITPICPHGFYTRSIAIPPQKKVHIEIEKNTDEIFLTLDGQRGMQLSPGDRVSVSADKRKASFLRLHNRSFFDVLRTKLKQRYDDSGERYDERR